MYIQIIFNKTSKFTQYRKDILMHKNEVRPYFIQKKISEGVFKTKTYGRNYKTI